MRLLEFYGIEKMNIGSINDEYNNTNIKDRRSYNRSLFLQKIPKEYCDNDYELLFDSIEKDLNGFPEDTKIKIKSI